MVAFNTLKAGDVVYETRRQKMGNTTISQNVTWSVRIIEVHLEDPDKESNTDYIMFSWNSNAPQKAYRSSKRVRGWRRTEPKKK